MDFGGFGELQTASSRLVGLRLGSGGDGESHVPQRHVGHQQRHGRRLSTRAARRRDARRLRARREIRLGPQRTGRRAGRLLLWIRADTGQPNTQICTRWPKKRSAETVHFSVIYITHTHTHPFNGPFSGTTQVSRYQKGKTNLDFTKARDSEWQWHQLGHMQVCISLQTDNHASTPPLCFLQAGCPSCRPTNSVKALKAKH